MDSSQQYPLLLGGLPLTPSCLVGFEDFAPL